MPGDGWTASTRCAAIERRSERSPRTSSSTATPGTRSSARSRTPRRASPIRSAAARPRHPPPRGRRAPVAKLSELATRPGLATASAPARAGVGASTTVRAFDGPVRLAAGSDVQVTDARGLPYPVLALATLAALLLATAAAARLVTRRRGPGGTPDR